MAFTNNQILIELLNLAQKVPDLSVKFWLDNGQIRFYATNMKYQTKQRTRQNAKKRKFSQMQHSSGNSTPTLARPVGRLPRPRHAPTLHATSTPILDTPDHPCDNSIADIENQNSEFSLISNND